MGVYEDSRGVLRKVGTDEGKSLQKGGAIAGVGANQILEWTLDLTLLDETEAVQNHALIIPDNALIEWVEVITLVAAADGTSIDVGTVHTSLDTSDSEYTADPNGILAAFATATMSEVGEYTKFTKVTAMPAATATDGALIGTVTTAPTLLTASITDSTAYTAGKIKLRMGIIPQALSATAG
jgi:hypothetical protein